MYLQFIETFLRFNLLKQSETLTLLHHLFKISSDLTLNDGDSENREDEYN